MKEADASPAHARLGEILDEYVRAANAGHAPDREALVARHPELAGEIAAALLGLDFVRGAAPGLMGAEESPEAAIGRSLGDYRLLREVGRGGMAVVYEAEQVSLGRRVAIKVLPFAAVLDSKQLQRFKNEALAAAHLRHPNIVPVYGVGCERGIHYYAMQYVEGSSLAAAIRDLKGGGGLGSSDDTRPRSAGEGPRTPISSHGSNLEPAFIRMAAALGVQAAEALDHAHELGIVHRDVKPGNLLVDAAGTLWVTDFGLASSVADVSLTVTGEILGTIRYMSPEQALAKRVPIDHRTDVYSLGATLYELFTLEPAFPGDDPHLVIQDIASREPVPPRRINPALPRDLETVLLKAMSKDPSGRYATAQELADDLQRWLKDAPVLARRPSIVARAARRARKHGALLAAVVTILVIGVLALAVGAKREERNTRVALRAAERNLDLAHEALGEWLAPSGIDGIKTDRSSPVPRAALEKALVLCNTLTKDADPRGHVTRSFILKALDRSDEALAAADEAIRIDPTLAPAHYARGVALGPGALEEELKAYDRAIALDAGLWEAHFNRGCVLRQLGRDTEALAAYDRALEVGAEQPHRGPMNALCHCGRATALLGLGRLPDALAAYDRAIELDPDHAQAHAGRAKALGELGRHDEALVAADQAIRIDPRSGTAHLRRGDALRMLGRLEDALAACDRAIELDPDDAEVHCGRGWTLTKLGRHEEAMVALDRAIVIDPRSAYAHLTMGEALRLMGQFEKSLAALDRAIELSPGMGRSHSARGLTLHSLQKFDAALQSFDRANEIDPNDASAHANRGSTLNTLGRPSEALAAADRAIRINPGLGAAHDIRGASLARLGRFEEAVAAHREAIRLDPGAAISHHNLGTALGNLGDWGQATGAFREAIRIRPDYAEPHCCIGIACMVQGRYQEAVTWLQKAIDLGQDCRDALEYAERHADRERRMDEVLKGAAAHDVSERLEFVDMLRKQSRYAECATMYAAAFADAPSVAEDLTCHNRYNAACAAALAATQAADAAHWRGQALDWLRADVAAREQAGLAATFSHWKSDPDLSSVRDDIDDLPEPEREAWRSLWASVDAALKTGRPLAK